MTELSTFEKIVVAHVFLVFFLVMYRAFSLALDERAKRRKDDDDRG